MTAATSIDNLSTVNTTGLNTIELEDSISRVITSLTGQNPKGPIEQAKVGEDLLFAAVVHKRLSKSNPELAKQFLKELPSQYNKKIANRERQPIFQSVESILEGMTKKGKITSDKKDNLIQAAFGKAQLDNTPSTLRRKMPDSFKNQVTESGETFLQAISERVSANKKATDKALDRFLAKIESSPTLSEAQAKRQSAALDEIFKDVKAKAPEQPPQNPPPATVTPEAKPIDPLPTEKDVITGPNDFVFSPKGADGNAEIKLPVAITSIVSGVQIEDLNGNILLNFENGGKTDDGRRIFRSKLPGIASSPILFRFHLIDGTSVKMELSRGDKFYTESMY